MRAARGHRSTGGEEKRDVRKTLNKRIERERERESKKQACAMLDGQQWAANSARLFAKQSAPRRKQRETIGHCFESGEAIAKKRGKNVDVGVEGKYLGGGGAIRRKRERERKEACLWSLEISLIDWPQGESTKLLKIAMHLKCGQHLIHDKLMVTGGEIYGDDWTYLFDYETIVKPREILYRNYSRLLGFDVSFYMNVFEVMSW